MQLIQQQLQLRQFLRVSFWIPNNFAGSTSYAYLHEHMLLSLLFTWKLSITISMAPVEGRYLFVLTLPTYRMYGT